MNYIGTSGWSYPSFSEFYGEKRTSQEQLAFYAGKFNTVEVNYTFYHFPKIETFQKWESATPKEFRFSLKLHRQFTHIDRLHLSATSVVKLEDFLTKSQALGSKLAVLLIQTPKSLKYDLKRLEAFLEVLTKCLGKQSHQPKLAFEFRNPDWFNENLYALCRHYQSVLVIAQSSHYPEVRVVTTDTLYFRFHGPSTLFDSPYSQEELQKWKIYIESCSGVRNIFAYFNNTMRGQAIENALYLRILMKKKFSDSSS